MKQQNVTILLLILMSMVGAKALAYDIAVENEDGVTIYYNYINDGKELEVAKQYRAYNGLTNLKIPAEVTFMNRTRKVTSIEAWAFHPNSYYSHNIVLTTIYIPKTINHIGKYAFWDCETLEKVYIEDVGAWCEINFELEGGQGLLSNPLRYAKHLFRYDNTEITELIIPEGTTKIGYGAFYNCLSFASVKIANSVKAVEEDAFYGAENLNRVDVGNGVNSIGDYAFYGCKNLNTVSFGDGIKSIGGYAFQGSNSLDKIIVNDIEVWCGIDFKYEQYGTPFLRDGTYTQPDKYIHLYSDDTHIISDLIIPESVSTIKEWAFHGFAGIKSIVIPDEVISIERDAFSYCPDLENVKIGEGVTEIGWKVFGGCSKLRDVKFGKNVTKIGQGAFGNCGFTYLSLPEGIKEIGAGSFENCSNLTSLTLPSTVIEIDVGAFGGADIYSIISLIEEPFPIATHYSYTSGTYYPFSKNTINNATLYVPIGTIEKYKETDGWKDFVYIEEISDDTPITPDNPSDSEDFFTYDGVKYFVVSQTDQTVEVASSNQSAGSDGPSSYSGDIVIPSTVSNANKTYTVIGIGQSAFVNCVGITSVTLPNTLTYIGKEAFNLCLGLKSITIPSSVTSYGYNVFSLTSITEITVLNPIPVEVPYNAFYYPQSNNNCILYVPYGSANAYRKANEWNKFKQIVEMKKDSDILDGHEFVDLGLPSGLLWATMNVGATKPEDSGSYFAWGETTPKSEYSWENYKYGQGSWDLKKITKYCNSSEYGVIDNKMVLEENDDAATTNWGKTWRTPTYSEAQELIDCCTWTSDWIVDGLLRRGFYVKGPNGNSIYIPIGGYMDEDLSIGYDIYCIMTASVGFYSSETACIMNNTGDKYRYWYRFYGYNVRPVKSKKANQINEAFNNEVDSIKAIYDIRGNKRENLQKGVNIVVYNNGKSRKIFK